MKSLLKRIFSYAVPIFLLTVMTAGDASAQATTTADPPCLNSHNCDTAADRLGPSLIPVSKPSTDIIVDALKDTNRGCNEILVFPPKREFDKEFYQIDCLRLHYKKIADSMPDNGDYKDVKKALENAAKKLDKIVRDNQDKKAPTVQIKERGKPDAPVIDTPVRPIKKERLQAAKAAAEAVIKETALIILRSGEIPTRRNVHYTEISAAVTSNLVVIRSA